MYIFFLVVFLNVHPEVPLIAHQNDKALAFSTLLECRDFTAQVGIEHAKKAYGKQVKSIECMKIDKRDWDAQKDTSKDMRMFLQHVTPEEIKKMQEETIKKITI